MAIKVATFPPFIALMLALLLRPMPFPEPFSWASMRFEVRRGYFRPIEDARIGDQRLSKRSFAGNPLCCAAAGSLSDPMTVEFFFLGTHFRFRFTSAASAFTLEGSVPLMPTSKTTVPLLNDAPNLPGLPWGIDP